MPAAAPVPKRRRWRRRLLWSAGILFASVVAFLGFALTPYGRSTIDTWERSRGFHRFESAPSILRAALSVPVRALRPSDAPRLEVQLKPKHLRRLQELRQLALAKGLIEDSEQEQVPAVVVFDDAPHDARARLKGDFTDHLQGDKWSLRIELEDGAFLGMRRFSIQAPETKGYQGEVLYFAAMRLAGVLAPRYEFARVKMAGRNVGVMAVEEHVGPDLLQSQGRPDGAVVHFDESSVFHGHDDYRDATVLVFGEKRLVRDPVLAPAAAAAVVRMRAFIDGLEPAAAVFHVDRVGAFLATATVFGSWHGVRWHNLRFAYDVNQQRLEPVAFDGNLHMRRPLPVVVAGEEDLFRRMLQDSAIREAYERALRALCRQVLDGDLLAQLQAAEAPVLRRLQSEYWLLEAFPMQDLRARAEHFAALAPEDLRAGCKAGKPPLPVGAWLVDAPGGVRLHLQNRGAAVATVRQIVWNRQDGSDEQRPFDVSEPAALPIVLPAGMQVPMVVTARTSGDAAFLEARVALEIAGTSSSRRAARNPPPALFMPR